MSIRYFSFYLLFFWSCSVIAQKPIWNEIILEDESNLFALQNDTIGFIWAISEDGLFKYDGFGLTKKLSSQDASITFKSLSSDTYYNLIIGTSDGHVIQYNPYLDKVIKMAIQKKSFPITYMDCIDPDSDCVLLSYGNGVNWKMPGLDTFLTTENILISNEVYAAVLEKNKIVLATDQGIQIIEKNDEQHFVSRKLTENDGLGDIIIANIIKHEDEYWASNFDSQIYKIDAATFFITIIDLPTRSNINGLKFINGSDFIVFTDTGIQSYEDEKWIRTYPNKGIHQVADITEDEENNLWVCSNSNTLSMANLRFLLMPNKIDKSQAIVKIGNSFWIGSSEGLYRVEGDKSIKILNKNVTCLDVMNNDILVGTFSSGIFILNHKGNVIKHIDGWENNPNQSVLYLYPTMNELFVSSLTGVIKMKLSKSGDKYETSNFQNLNNILGPGYIYQILEKDGDLFFATDRQGIKIIRNDDLQHILHFDNGLTLGSIYSMTKCKDERVWFSSSIGYIGYVKDTKVYHIDNERLLKDPYTSLITSSDQKIIMVRNSSIDVYDPISQHFLYYENIMQSNDHELFLNSYTQEENSIWLAIPNNIIQIKNFSNQKMVPEPIINQVMVNLTNIGQKNSFKEDQNNLEFKYSAAWMTDPDRITYQYKMEGLDDQWRNTRDHSAVYPMLRHGIYNFKVNASIDGKFTNESIKSFGFEINQPFYKTWWFILLMLVSFGGIIRNWRNGRKKARLQKEDLNKKRIEAQLISLQTQLNPHFLFNSFNTLIGLIEENPQKGITFTEKLTDFYRDILEVGKNDLILLRDEIQLLNTYIHLIKERFGEQLQIYVRVDDIDSYKIPPLTLQLLIENAVKHNIVSTKNPLHISIVQNNAIIEVRNKLAPKYGNTKGAGLGLDNIKKRHTLNNLKPPLIKLSDTHYIVTVYLNKTKK